MSVTIKKGEMVRVCQKNSCGKTFSNHLSSCPHCGNRDYKVKVLEKDTVVER